MPFQYARKCPRVRFARRRERPGIQAGPFVSAPARVLLNASLTSSYSRVRQRGLATEVQRRDAGQELHPDSNQRLDCQPSARQSGGLHGRESTGSSFAVRSGPLSEDIGFHISRRNAGAPQLSSAGAHRSRLQHAYRWLQPEGERDFR